MAVLVSITATGMDQATYDQMAPNLHPLVKQQPGFILHYAYPTSSGFAIGEVWESRAQQEAWFNTFVKPNLPESNEMTTGYSEIHSVVQP
jgi:heme-degrading monooxygenase HmoA